MGAAGYIKETNLEELYLGYNKLTNKGAVEIVKGCRGSKIKKLGLGFNRGITDEGVLQIAENIEGTELEEIDLRQYKDCPIGISTQEFIERGYPRIKWIFA